MMVVPSLAHAGVPVATPTSPAPLSEVSVYDPTVRADFVAQDGAGMLPTVVATIDGVPYITSMLWTGPNSGAVIFKPRSLSNGVHSVHVAATDILGRPAEANWLFSVAMPALVVNPTPALNAEVNLARPTFQASLSRNPGIAAMSVTWDGTPGYLKYNTRAGTLTFTPPASLIDGVHHDVEMHVVDRAGRDETMRWHVLSNYGSSVSLLELSPADGGTVTQAATSVFFRLYAPGGLKGSMAYVTLDAQTYGVSMAFEDAAHTTGRATVAVGALADGQHDLRIVGYAADGTGRGFGSSFSVGAPPQIGSATPKAGSLVDTLTPTISAAVTDNVPAGLLGQFIVDGASYPAVYSAGRMTAPAVSLEDARSYDVTLTVTDATGLTDSAEWSFSTLMVRNIISRTCSDCHDQTSHAMTCNSCHHSPDDGTPNTCSSCHGNDSHGTERLTGKCQECHDNPVVGWHGVDITPLHRTSSSIQACASCHLNYLDLEHANHSNANGVMYDCATCHESSDGSVRDAIVTGDTSCGACHSADALRHMELHDAQLDPDCADCHDINLVTQHAEAGFSCETCHDSTRQDVVDAIATHNRDCDACHVLHGVGATLCLGCHTTSLLSGAYPGASVAQGSKHQTTSASTVAATAWPGVTASTPCTNCHAGHQGLRAQGTSLCFTCHDAAGTSKPAMYAYRSAITFTGSEHGARGGAGGSSGSCLTCHAVHDAPGLADTAALKQAEADGCFNCHNSASNSANGVNIQAKITAGATDRTRHDVDATAQVASGAKTPCSACHNVHADTRALPLANPDDIAQGVALSADPFTSAPTAANPWCLQCHDGTVPAGVTNRAGIRVISSSWTSDYHGQTAGNGAGGTMLAPYVRGGSNAVSCAACHDSHGSASVNHVPASVNGRAVATVAGGNDYKYLCAACHSGTGTNPTLDQKIDTWHAACVNCHGESHSFLKTANCDDCHKHGETFEHDTWGCYGWGSCHSYPDWVGVYVWKAF